MPSPNDTAWTWLRNGDEAFAAMLAAMDAARQSICLEIYTYSAGPLGVRFREALLRARQRGVGVRVLVDAFGSLSLPDGFWSPLRAAGGEARFFNPVALNRFEIRNHRKLLVCDETVAFVGGFNIASEYEGDGVTRGWRDVGLSLTGPLAAQLAASFDEMFALAEFRHKRFARLRRPVFRHTVAPAAEQLLLSGPGRGFNRIRRVLRKDLARARNAQVMVGYFLPTGRLRRALQRVARHGQLRLLLAAKSDVLLAQLAGQSLYRRFLKAGAEIYEYEPQILHAKLFIVDNAVYVGSANLDPRSLGINYELVIRFENPKMAAEARAIFGDALQHCRRIDPAEWRRARTFWGQLKRRWAYFLLARIDPYMARKQWRALPD
ncbi:MAG TPA: phosphatidylserine/phosphatidylglycerophosphate/cardiolipin synthase family protein [Verrucomicrobiae bacterium]|nr:phosphatidylserine/phosphatidylglycerophosphate/cardiolipin synthase family protein [Verrucomicrobiae bacterium]